MFARLFFHTGLPVSLFPSKSMAALPCRAAPAPPLLSTLPPAPPAGQRLPHGADQSSPIWRLQGAAKAWGLPISGPRKKDVYDRLMAQVGGLLGSYTIPPWAAVLLPAATAAP